MTNSTGLAARVGVLPAKPMTSHEGARSARQSHFLSATANATQRGTFSRAGGPRLKGQNDIMDKLTNRSLYQQIAVQNIEANRNNDLPRRQRAAVSQSFKSAQKTFSKCNALNEASKVGWSVLDVDLTRIGGASQSVRGQPNICTNEPGLYKDGVFHPKTQTPGELAGNAQLGAFYVY